MNADQGKHWSITPQVSPWSWGGTCQSSGRLDKPFGTQILGQAVLWKRAAQHATGEPRHSSQTSWHEQDDLHWRSNQEKTTLLPRGTHSPGGKDQEVCLAYLFPCLFVCWRGGGLDWPKVTRGHRWGWFLWSVTEDGTSPDPLVLAPCKPWQAGDYACEYDLRVLKLRAQRGTSRVQFWA